MTRIIKKSVKFIDRVLNALLPDDELVQRKAENYKHMPF